MPRNHVILNLQSRLEREANPRSHAFWNNYMKGALPFRGVPMAGIRKVTHAWWKAEGCQDLPPPERLALSLSLIRCRHGEDKQAGILVMDEILGAELQPEALPALADLFDQGHVADWSTCDWLCLKVLGKLAARALPDTGPALTLAGWATAPGLWRRRAANVSFIRLAAGGEATFPGFTALMLDTCRQTLRHRERFAQTGAGWLLRELAKADLNAVVGFLRESSQAMSREGLRYATEGMPPAVRAAVMEAAAPRTGRRRPGSMAGASPATAYGPTPSTTT